MVDRITPAMNPALRDSLNSASGVQDQAPVIAEDFIQWVLEDNFKYGRPAYEVAGKIPTFQSRSNLNCCRSDFN